MAQQPAALPTEKTDKPPTESSSSSLERVNTAKQSAHVPLGTLLKTKKKNKKKKNKAAYQRRRHHIRGGGPIHDKNNSDSRVA